MCFYFKQILSFQNQQQYLSPVRPLSHLCSPLLSLFSLRPLPILSLSKLVFTSSCSFFVFVFLSSFVSALYRFFVPIIFSLSAWLAVYLSSNLITGVLSCNPAHLTLIREDYLQLGFSCGEGDSQNKRNVKDTKKNNLKQKYTHSKSLCYNMQENNVKYKTLQMKIINS